ncbi:hypothetical protein [Streptomyces sp. NPDC018000]|uniref:hypothetical protein n=1 Tax=Streptomyces sp. NPDC018000 TaxID=3365028 RepID=UPI0037A4A98A
MSTQETALHALLTADVDRLTAELRRMLPTAPREYRPWVRLSTAERAAEVYFTADRNRAAADLREAEDRLAEFERVRATLPPLVLRLWIEGRYGSRLSAPVRNLHSDASTVRMEHAA